MSRLNNFFNYELIKKKELKENSSNESTAFDNKIKEIHGYLYDCLKNYHKVEHDGGSLREYMYYRLYCSIIELNGEISTDAPQETHKYIDLAYDAMSEMRNKLERYAMNSGDYAEYQEDSYNYEKTRDNAYDYGLVKLAKDYFSVNVDLKIAKDVLKKADKILETLEDEYSEPEFSGDFDDVEVSKPSEKNNEYKAFSKYVVDLNNASTEKNVPQILELIDMDKVKSLYGNYDSFAYLEEDIKEIIYQVIDDYYSDERQWDWVAYDEGEFDEEATWSRIYDLQTSDLMDDYFDQNDARDLLEEILPNLNKVFKICGLTEFDLNTGNEISQEPESEDSGDEYNE